jgi:CubicO group peptidase (beta-lactamase class C family)
LSWVSARDWARFGLLYFNKGVWNVKQILQNGWIQYAITPSKESKKGYGAH